MFSGLTTLGSPRNFIGNITLGIFYWEYFIGNIYWEYLLEILYSEYLIGNVIFGISYWEYYIRNILLGILYWELSLKIRRSMLIADLYAIY